MPLSRSNERRLNETGRNAHAVGLNPPRVVASAARIADELGWKARYDVTDMITSAGEGWVRLHPGPRPRRLRRCTGDRSLFPTWV